MRKIILLGYMGSGKSVTAQKLSEKTNIPAVDLDEFIEEVAQSSIKTIFSEKGEIYFRKLEHKTFNQLLENKDDLILALGGGTPCYANNHEQLNGENVVSFYLKASIATLYERLLDELQNRPLLSNLNEEELKEYIAKHLFDRSYFYNQATHVVSVDEKSVDEIADEILSKLT